MAELRFVNCCTVTNINMNEYECNVRRSHVKFKGCEPCVIGFTVYSLQLSMAVWMEGCVSVQMVNFAYGDKYAAFLHDAVLLYAIALNETIAKGQDYAKMRLYCLY